MAKTKQEKIASIQEQIQQLKNQEKQLLLTDEHFKTFLEKTVLTDQSRRILDGLTAQNAAVCCHTHRQTLRCGTGFADTFFITGKNVPFSLLKAKEYVLLVLNNCFLSWL